MNKTLADELRNLLQPGMSVQEAQETLENAADYIEELECKVSELRMDRKTMASNLNRISGVMREIKSVTESLSRS